LFVPAQSTFSHSAILDNFSYLGQPLKNLVKNPFKSSIKYFLVLAFLGLTACGGGNNESGNSDSASSLITTDDTGVTQTTDALNNQVSSLPTEQISSDEESSLRFIREEEKLARDVYLALYDKWGQNVFDNIATAEQTHTDTVKSLLEKYSISDPVTDATRGVFENQTLQGLYDSKTAVGFQSLVDALKIGALIEEIDIKDIKDAQEAYIDNEDINLVYDNLRKGSRNHLRSFVQNLSNKGETYVPQVLTQAAYDAIITSDMER